VSLTVKEQAPHANPVKGTSVEQEEHPTTKDLVAALLELGRSEPRLNWVNCGLCVDERGAGSWIDGVKRGGPANFLEMAVASTTTLVIPTK
jgi:tRNA 2-thiouridine synthesizing protein D